MLQGGFDWGGFASGLGGFSSPGKQGAPRKPREPEEPFYGFNEFFKDVETEWGKRRKRAASQEPGTLLEELAAIGEDILTDFVEFLESELGLPPEEGVSLP